MEESADLTTVSRANSKQILTLTILVLGYMAFYGARANLSVSTTSIIKEFASSGFTKESLGAITSIGTLFYAIGKFFGGSFADRLTGKASFLFGMASAALFTILMTILGPAALMFLWSGNRFTQAMGWPGMVRVTGHWFPKSRFGTAMGIVSLSYLFGPFLSKMLYGQMFDAGMNWRQIFYFAAAGLIVMFVATIFLLKEAPDDHKDVDPTSAKPATQPPVEIFRRLFSNRLFWIVCILSFGFTLMRETFNNWTPTYLEEVAGLSKGDASRNAGLFDLFGGFSVLIAGFMSDRIGPKGRPIIISFGLAFTTIGLFILSQITKESGANLTVFLIPAIAFVMIGPYSFLAGSLSLDMGGQKGGATASGWIDGIGYFGGIISGWYIGSIAEKQGWTSAFTTIAIACAITLVVAFYYQFSVSKTIENK
ncbi:MAG: MFS transporter [Fimbriimonadaceae bacterium]